MWLRFVAAEGVAVADAAWAVMWVVAVERHVQIVRMCMYSHPMAVSVMRMGSMEEELRVWGGIRIVGRLGGGNRNHVGSGLLKLRRGAR
jgi:hypothetical protein